jgi:hypothetical protein
VCVCVANCPFYFLPCCLSLQQIQILFTPPPFLTSLPVSVHCLIALFCTFLFTKLTLIICCPFSHFTRIPFIARFLHKNRVQESRLEQSGTKCLLLAVFVLTEVWRNGGCRRARPSLLCLQEERLERFKVKVGGADAVLLRACVMRQVVTIRTMSINSNISASLRNACTDFFCK